jgi:carboxypeptidase T
VAWPTNDWPTAQEIYDRLKQLAGDNRYKDICKVFDFVTIGGKGGPTQGNEASRTTNYVRIGRQDSPPGKRSTVVIIAGVHAREWAPPRLVTNLVQRLVDAFATSSDIVLGGATYDKDKIKAIIDKVDLYIAPMINPDGYEWSRTQFRMWRKNRRPPPSPIPQQFGTCLATDPFRFGVDINRNFPVIWNFEQTFSPAGVHGNMSKNPCDDEVYVGESAGSERETQNVMFLVEKNPQYFVDVHMKGNKIYYSWGTDDNEEIDGPTPALQTTTPRDGTGGVTKDKINKAFLKEIKTTIGGMMETATALAGTPFELVQSADLGAFSGASDDYALSRNLPTVPGGKQPIRAYTIECGATFTDNATTQFAATEKAVQSALIRLLVHATTSEGLKAGDPVPGSGTTPPPKSCSNCSVAD